jgi:hypothetical protein
MHEDTKAAIITIVGVFVIFVFGMCLGDCLAESDQYPPHPPQYELECVDNPDQKMLCKSYCGYPPKRKLTPEEPR